MWSLISSKGHRVDGIRREQDARRAVHALGMSSVISPYSWQIVDNHGDRFIAEIRRAS